MLARQQFRGMSIEKPQQKQNQKQKEKSNDNLKMVLAKQNSYRFHQLVKDPFMTGDTQTIFCFNPLNGTVTNPRKRYLVIKNTEYIIANWTQDKFPNVIYICLKDYAKGYIKTTVDQTGAIMMTNTSRIAALQLSQVSVTMDDSNIRTYDLKYINRDPIAWDIDLTLATYKFSIQVDDALQAQVLPLPNPLSLNIEYRVQ